MRGTAASGVWRVEARVREAVGSARWKRYLEPGQTVRYDAGTLDVVAPSAWVADYLQRQFGEDMRNAAREASGDAEVHVRFRVESSLGDSVAVDPIEHAPSPTPAAPSAPTHHTRPARANPETWRRLDEFEVGETNRLAFEVARRVGAGVDMAGMSPLFLHGSCGVGKTHLLQGIAQQRRETGAGTRVRYTTGEAFTNGFVQALQANKLEAFRRAHRDIDLLCVDDVHFLANKTATQTELLHTLDAAISGGAQVALASDAHPREIERFAERLISRFLGGMVVRVETPDEPTRERIARRLAERRGLVLESGAARCIVERSGASVRELEGAVARVEAVHRLLGGGSGEIGVSSIERALGVVQPARVRRPVSVREIAARVCARLGVAPEDVFGRSKHRRVVLARSLTAYLARQMTTRSFPEIARELNRPNHSTVVTAVGRYALQVERDETVDGGELGRLSARSLSDTLKREVLAAAD